MINNFGKMMNNQNIPDNIKNILNSMNNAEKNTNSENNTSNNMNDFSNNNSNSSNTNNPFGNIDMATLLKMQQIMSSLNENQNDSRTNLLMSLKPYLKERRKKKVDQYVQLMKMGKILELMNPLGGDNKHV